MADLTIGKKLFTGISTLLTLTAVLGWIGLRNAADLNARLADAAGSITQQVEHSYNVVVQSGGLYENSLEMIGAASQNDTARLERVKNATAAETNALEKEIETLDQVVDSDQDHRDVGAIRAELARWKSVLGRLQAELDAAKLSEANLLEEAEVKPAAAALVKAAKVIADSQSVQMDESRKAGAEGYAMQRVVAIAILVLSLLIGLGLEWLVRGMNVHLRQVATELSERAVHTSAAASQVAASGQSLAQGSSEQAASLEETSASTEQINSMASKNTDNSRSASQLMTQSQQGFVEANQALEQMVVSMNEISSSSERISRVIKMIDEISFQTNILALNAAVEAARAGEAGMGFAVVAEEVRNLAQRCAQAAKDTAALIEESISRSSEGKSKVDHVVVLVRTISGELGRVKILVDEVDAGSREQARGIEQINKAITQMEQVTQTTAASAEEGAAAAEELSSQSEALKGIVQRLTAMVGSDGSAAANRSITEQEYAAANRGTAAAPPRPSGYTTPIAPSPLQIRRSQFALTDGETEFDR